MTRSKRLRRRQLPQSGDAGSDPSGTGGFAGQIGLFETANGGPHGPVEIALAFVLAAAVYPIGRLVRRVARR